MLFFFFVCVLIKVARENQFEEMGVTALSGMRSSSPPCGVCYLLAVLLGLSPVLMVGENPEKSNAKELSN